MAVHKVPQDVEADDKFLGPLTFKQFIFFGVAAVSGYLTFLSIAEKWYILTPVLLVPFFISAVLAFPWSKEQPTELWLASRIRFLLKPRKRIWDQSGAKLLVNITAPKKEVFAMTDGLDQNEVRHRFNAFATLVDSRGWAIKNVTNMPTGVSTTSDRLVANASVAPATTIIEEQFVDTVDSPSSPIAQQFDSMIHESEAKQRSKTLELIERARKESNASGDLTAVSMQTTQQVAVQPDKPTIQNTLKAGQSSSQQPSALELIKRARQQSSATTSQATTDMAAQNTPTQVTTTTPVDNTNTQIPNNFTFFQSSTIVTPGQSATTQLPVTPVADTPVDEAAFLQTAHEKHRRDELQTSSRHEKVILPQSETNAQQNNTANNQSQLTTPQPAMTHTPDPAILDLAKNNDLNIETLSRQAKKNDDGEVVISLH